MRDFREFKSGTQSSLVLQGLFRIDADNNSADRHEIYTEKGDVISIKLLREFSRNVVAPRYHENRPRTIEG